MLPQLSGCPKCRASRTHLYYDRDCATWACISCGERFFGKVFLPMKILTHKRGRPRNGPFGSGLFSQPILSS